MADYSISLGNGYEIARLSAHEIAIYGDEPVQSDDDTRTNFLYVPAKITEVWWNDQYIIAKQMELEASENGYEQPPKDTSQQVFTYWVIDVQNYRIQNTFKEEELENEIEKLGITGKVQFTSVEDLRTK